MDLQKYSDKILAATLLPFIPKKVTPNQVTWVRIILLPIIYYLLINKIYSYGLILFSIAALSNAVDGALARTRNQITELGKVLDPLADKTLIFLVSFIFIPRFFGWPLLLGIIVLELFNGVMAYKSKKANNINPGANWVGKIKMIIQSVAFIIILIGVFFNLSPLLNYAGALLYISLAFTFLQGFIYPK